MVYNFYMSANKKRVVKDFEKLDFEIREQIKLSFPSGFSEHLISFKNKDGNLVSALPFETEEVYYLVRMTVIEAQEIIEEDDDYDEDGNLKDDVKEDYEDKYSEEDEEFQGDDEFKEEAEL